MGFVAVKSGLKRDAFDLKGAHELALIFGGLLFIGLFVPGLRGTAGVTLSPFWVPVLLLAVQYGTMTGLAAAVIATAVSLTLGEQPPQAGEDYYAHFLKLWRDPMLWLAAVLVVGAISDKRIRQRDALAESLRQADEQRHSITCYCDQLEWHAEQLERRIAASEALTLEDGLIALNELHESTLAGAGPALVRAVEVMLGPDTRFSILTRTENGLSRAQFDSVGGGLELDADARAATPGDHAFFQAMVLLRRTLSALRGHDAQLLNGVGIAAGPIVEDGQRLAGVLVIEQVAQPMTVASEVAVRTICAELSHVAAALPRLFAAPLPESGAREGLRIVA